MQGGYRQTAGKLHSFERSAASGAHFGARPSPYLYDTDAGVPLVRAANCSSINQSNEAGIVPSGSA